MRTIALVIAVIGLVGGLITIGLAIGDISNAVIGIAIQHGDKGFPLVAGAYVLRPIIYWTIIVIIPSLVAISIAVILRQRRLMHVGMRRYIDTLDSLKQDVADRNTDIMRAKDAHQSILDSLYSYFSRSPFYSSLSLLKHDTIDTIVRKRMLENSDAEITLTQTIRALEEIRYWQLRFESDSYAAEIRYLNDVKIHVRDLDGRSIKNVVLLPTRISAHKIEIVIMFIESLKPGQLFSCEITLSWPKYFARFMLDGIDEVYWRTHNRSSTSSTDITFIVEIPRSFGPVEINSIGNSGDGEDIKHAAIQNNNQYTYRTISTAELQHSVHLSIRRAKN